MSSSPENKSGEEPPEPQPSVDNRFKFEYLSRLPVKPEMPAEERRQVEDINALTEIINRLIMDFATLSPTSKGQRFKYGRQINDMIATLTDLKTKLLYTEMILRQTDELRAAAVTEAIKETGRVQAPEPVE